MRTRMISKLLKKQPNDQAVDQAEAGVRGSWLCEVLSHLMLAATSVIDCCF